VAPHTAPRHHPRRRNLAHKNRRGQALARETCSTDRCRWAASRSAAAPAQSRRNRAEAGRDVGRPGCGSPATRPDEHNARVAYKPRFRACSARPASWALGSVEGAGDPSRSFGAGQAVRGPSRPIAPWEQGLTGTGHRITVAFPTKGGRGFDRRAEGYRLGFAPTRSTGGRIGRVEARTNLSRSF
jgi:hypothetical protein